MHIPALWHGTPPKTASTPDVKATLAADCCVETALNLIKCCSAVRDSACDHSIGRFLRKLRLVEDPAFVQAGRGVPIPHAQTVDQEMQPIRDSMAKPSPLGGFFTICSDQDIAFI
jgi:hypothetical protein